MAAVGGESGGHDSQAASQVSPAQAKFWAMKSPRNTTPASPPPAVIARVCRSCVANWQITDGSRPRCDVVALVALVRLSGEVCFQV